MFLKGQGEEGGKPAPDEVKERPVEGGLGGAVRGEAFHHHHWREQEQSGKGRVSPRVKHTRIQTDKHIYMWNMHTQTQTHKRKYA